MARLFFVLVLVAVMGGKAMGRPVPYTASDHSPFEGEQMMEIERLRLRGVSEKDIYARYANPRLPSLAIRSPSNSDLTSRNALSIYLHNPFPSAGVASDQRLEKVSTVDDAMQGDKAQGQKDITVDARVMGDVGINGAKTEDQAEKVMEVVEGKDVEVNKVTPAEEEANEEMKTWLDRRTLDIQVMGNVATITTDAGLEAMEGKADGEEGDMVERGEDMEDIDEEEGLGQIDTVNDETADDMVERAEGMTNPREEEASTTSSADEELAGEISGWNKNEVEILAIQPSIASGQHKDERKMNKALEEWRRAIRERSESDQSTRSVRNVLGKRSADADAEDGGLGVRGQMGGLVAVRV